MCEASAVIFSSLLVQCTQSFSVYFRVPPIFIYFRISALVYHSGEGTLVDQNNLFGTGSPGVSNPRLFEARVKAIGPLCHLLLCGVWRLQPVIARLDTELLRVLLSRNHGTALRTLSLLFITFSWNSGESRRGRPCP